MRHNPIQFDCDGFSHHHQELPLPRIGFCAGASATRVVPPESKRRMGSSPSNSTQPIWRAGVPPTIVASGTSPLTKLFAEITHVLPMVVPAALMLWPPAYDRKSVVSGKSVSVREDL